MTAAMIAAVLGDARREGRGWRCRCPVHGGRSLVLSDGENGCVLATCWGGCDRRHVLGELRSRGLWGKNLRQEIVERRPAVERKPDPGDVKRTQTAIAIWESAVPASGTPVQIYLACRGLDLPATDVLRFHLGLKHPSGGVWPAMVAMVTNGVDERPVAIHRTYLVPDGKGKAPVHPQKIMLGPCRGGAVRLGLVRPETWLVVGEGLETTLTVMQSCNLPGWAALSATGLKNIILPPEVGEVLVCADNDVNGVGQRAAHAAAERFIAEGRRVRIATPATPGADFNDVLCKKPATSSMDEVRYVA